ncbi:MAG: 3-dehydroquinate synthase II [Thermodesulfobacteriota bacterium]|nr:3-dehydroquinate synthase II [Thermodesulfobacteriota bacterium]
MKELRVQLEEWSKDLATPEVEARSVAALEPGDAVLVSLEAGARRFGRPVEETIWEK